MLGFKFCGVHSSEFNIVYKSINRTLKSPARYEPIIIPHRHGQVDIQNKLTYDNRIISLNITLNEKGLNELRKKAREVAFWLSQRGRLEFDDEKGFLYNAACYEGINIDLLANTGMCELNFVCSPFAFKEAITKKINPGLNSFNYEGTAETPTKIILKNTTNTVISNIKISVSRKKR